MPAHICVLVNATAGANHQRDLVTTLETAFQAAGITARVELADSGAALGKALHEAVKEAPRIIVAGGGDGTINTVASALAGTDIALGVLPLGTLNHFAKDLGIPLALDDAIANIVAGHVIQVDIGEVNSRVFLNNSSLGIYPRLVRQRKHHQQMGWGRWRAFAWAVLTILRRHSFLSLRLTTGGESTLRRTPFVFIGNNEYHMEGFAIGTRDRLDAGTLSVHSVKHAGRTGLLQLALRALFGRLREAKDFEVFCTAEFRIESRRRRLHVATDGEVVLMDTPLLYRVRVKALKVVVPAARAQERGDNGG